jgi:hypothetical protein
LAEERNVSRAGLSTDDVTKPPIQVVQVFVNVPTGLKKTAFDGRLRGT